MIRQFTVKKMKQLQGNQRRKQIHRQKIKVSHRRQFYFNQQSQSNDRF